MSASSATEALTSSDGRIAVKPPSLYWTLRILLKPDLLLGQTYVDGRWSVEPSRLYEFLHLIRSQEHSRLQQWFLFANRFHVLRDALKQRVFPIRSTRAVVEHYDTDPVFMSLILGESMSYTCAFFDQDHSTLNEAQDHKLELVSKRIGLAAGQSVLDLGTGWGYAPFPLAECLGCRVTGITLSQAQVDFCEARRANSPAKDRLAFVRADYADFMPSRVFDRVISIGMLEHVGKFQYSVFFDKLAELLHDDGVALVHSMVEGEEISPDAWIDQNIFPGGYIPTMSEVVAGIEASRCDIVQIYTHAKPNYFRTLKLWMTNLQANRGRSQKRLEDIGLSASDATKALRIWEFFLSASQIAFSPEHGRCKVAQFVVRKKQ